MKSKSMELRRKASELLRQAIAIEDGKNPFNHLKWSRDNVSLKAESCGTIVLKVSEWYKEEVETSFGLGSAEALAEKLKEFATEVRGAGLDP